MSRGLIQPFKRLRLWTRDGKYWWHVYIFHTRAQMYNWQENYHQDSPQTINTEARTYGAMVMPYEIFTVHPDGSTERRPNIGIVLFHKERLGSGIIAHEMLHCALWQYRLNNGNAQFHPEEVTAQEEELAYYIGFLMQDLVKKLYKHKVYA